MTKLSLECKKLMVKEISERLNNADVLIVTSFKGLKAQDLNELRKGLRGISGDYVVVKDAMIKKVITKGPYSSITEFIKGEVGIAIDRKKEASDISKLLVRFSKNHEALKIYGGLMGGEVISKQEIAQLAILPSREVMLARLANVINAPIQGLASVLNAIITKLLYALNAIKDKKVENKTNPADQAVQHKEEQNG